MAINPDQIDWFADAFAKMTGNVSKVLLGKPDVIRLALSCMLADGHLLLEDAPGTGKTSLARAIAATVKGTDNRIQFTPDLLPSDVTGTNVFDQARGVFTFRPGPVFASIVLADEINRASPKTQSALLEVMEEGHVTVDGERRAVERPFMVIATQNPIEQAGTYPLPEAQLDRFLIKTTIGYPDRAATIELLGGRAQRDRTSSLKSIVSGKHVLQAQEIAEGVFVSDAILDYVAQLSEVTRDAEETRAGVSVRGSIAMIRVAKVWALSRGRDYVTPDDVIELAEPVWSHRLVLDPEAQFAGAAPGDVIKRSVAAVQPPAERIRA